MSIIPNQAPTSLDLNKNRIDILNSTLLSNLGGMMRILKDPGKNVAEELRKIIEEIYNKSMPEELRKELVNPDGFKRELRQAIYNFTFRMKDKTPTDDDIQLFVADIMSIFMTHQAFGLVKMGRLNKEIFNEFEPEIIKRYTSIQLQKFIGILIWFASSFTSWLGLTHYVGIGATWLGDKLAFNASAILSPALRHTISILGSGAISQIVQKFKEKIEDRANRENIPGWKALGRNIGQRGIFATPMIAAATLVLAFDVGTNINGIIMGILQQHSIRDQIEDAEKEINKNTDAIRDHIKKLELIPGKVQTEVNEMLLKEEGGTSETGRADRGPMYHAKRFVYLEDEESRRYLEQVHTPAQPQASNGKNGKMENVPQKEIPGKNFRKELRDAILASGIIDGKPLKTELDNKIAQQTETVMAILEEIKNMEKSLDESDEIESLQAKIDEITKKLQDALGIVNQDLSKQLSKRMQNFTDVNVRLVEIAKKQIDEKGQPRYPNIKPGEVKSWQLGDLSMNIKGFQFEKMKFIGFEDLLDVMNKEWDPTERTFFLALFVAMGYLFSYADMITLGWTRKAYNKDRQEAEERERWVRHFEDKLIHMLTLTINKGPFAQYFKPGRELDESIVKQAIEKRIEKGSTIEKDTRGKGNKFLRAVLPIPEGYEARGRTEVAVRHNARIRAMRSLMESPKAVQDLLEELLPGLRILKNPESSDSLQGVRMKTVHVVTEKNAAAQEKSMRTFLNQLFDVQKGMNAAISIDLWKKTHDNSVSLKKSIDEFKRDIVSGNESLLDELNSAYQKLVGALQKVPFMIVEKEAAELQIDENTGDSIILEKDEFFNDLLGIIEQLKQEENFNLQTQCATAESAIAGAKEKIADIRRIKKEIEEENRRINSLNRKSQIADNAVAKIEAWEATINGITKSDLAEKFAALLGKNYLIEPLEPDEKIDIKHVNDLENSYSDLVNNLDFFKHKNPEKHQDVERMKDNIAVAMSDLREYFPET